MVFSLSDSLIFISTGTRYLSKTGIILLILSTAISLLFWEIFLSVMLGAMVRYFRLSLELKGIQYFCPFIITIMPRNIRVDFPVCGDTDGTRLSMFCKLRIYFFRTVYKENFSDVLMITPVNVESYAGSIAFMQYPSQRKYPFIVPLYSVGNDHIYYFVKKNIICQEPRVTV